MKYYLALQGCLNFLNTECPQSNSDRKAWQLDAHKQVLWVTETSRIIYAALRLRQPVTF
jgi:hypothetical protein